jgi:hypothetical protein
MLLHPPAEVMVAELLALTRILIKLLSLARARGSSSIKRAFDNLTMLGLSMVAARILKRIIDTIQG